MTPLNDYLARLEELEKNATAGPWAVDPNSGDIVEESSGDRHHLAMIFAVLRSKGFLPDDDDIDLSLITAENNAQFITTARNGLPKLIQIIREMEGALIFYSRGSPVIGFEHGETAKNARIRVAKILEGGG